MNDACLSAAFVAVVDDDDLVLTSVCMLLASHGYRARGFASCQAFLDDPARSAAECLILDVRLPGITGPELQERLCAESLCPPVIFVSGHATVPLAVKAMRLGAVDFLQKPYDEAALLDRVVQARTRASEARRHELEKSALAGRREQLTAREREVLDALGAGLGNKQIADRLGISVRTVEQYRANLRKKLGARSLAELLRLAGFSGRP